MYDIKIINEIVNISVFCRGCKHEILNFEEADLTAVNYRVSEHINKGLVNKE